MTAPGTRHVAGGRRALALALASALPLSPAQAVRAEVPFTAPRATVARTPTPAAAQTGADCAGFDERALTVNSERELERLVEQAITLEAGEDGIPWDCLVESFDALAANTRIIVSPYSGPAGSDLYGFAIDRRSGLKPPHLLPMGSSGRFVALVRATRGGHVAIIDQRGTARWLDLGAPGRVAPLIDPLGRPGVR